MLLGAATSSRVSLFIFPMSGEPKKPVMALGHRAGNTPTNTQESATGNQSEHMTAKRVKSMHAAKCCVGCSGRYTVMHGGGCVWGGMGGGVRTSSVSFPL